jgi:hypothetical protein
VTAIDWPEGAYTHHGKQIGHLLGQVSMDELDQIDDRPVLSALVVGQDEGMPTGGYWKFLKEELGVPVPTSELDRLAVWAGEFEAACRLYGARAP